MAFALAADSNQPAAQPSLPAPPPDVPPSAFSRNMKRQRVESHRRNYQACDLCRKRKIRCDLGDLNEPQPPCTRCRRALKECTFASGYAVRQTRPFQPQQSSDPPSCSTQIEGRLLARNEKGSTTSGSSAAFNNQPRSLVPPTISIQPDDVLPESQVRFRGARSQSPGCPVDDEGAEALKSHAPIPGNLLATTVRDDTDALHLLFDTALRRTSQIDAHQAPELAGRVEHIDTGPPSSQHFNLQSGEMEYDLASRDLTDQVSPPYSARGFFWSQFRPCQQRSLSPAEAEAYLNFFFTVLNKQMPILSDWFSHSAHHEALLSEDSVLCYTILAIASRYLTLPGHNGHSRGYLLHDLFFRHVQDGLQQLLWGIPLDPQNGMTVAGALESLLLLTQWQPRGLHVQMSSLNFSTAHSENAFDDFARCHDDPVGADAMAIALRSDLMCWRLMNLASSLTHEHGLFNDQQGPPDKRSQFAGRDTRLPHIRRMLYLYTSGLAARLKRPNPFRDTPPALFKQQSEDRLSGHSVDWQKTLNGWVDLVEIGNVAAELLYDSQQGTRELIKSGKYVAMVHRSEHLLSQWWEMNNSYKVSAPFRYNIEIEYHYLRIYVHSVALQAILDRSVPLRGWRLTSHTVPAEYRSTPLDRQMLQEVVNSCCKIYERVIELHKSQALRNVTLPLLLRIITTAMFGLKVVALDLKEEIHLMQLLRKVTLALRESAIDDLHLAGYYGRLIDRLIQHRKPQPEAASDQPDENAQGLINLVDQHQDMAAATMYGRDDDWSDWLAFQFDPTLASIGETGSNYHNFLAGNAGTG